MLHNGLYEQIINKGLDTELSVTDKLSQTAPIDSAEASKVLAKYVAEIVEKGLNNVKDNGGNLTSQIELVNRIVSTISATFPFIPYQFIIIQKVLAEIRKHGNSGKHLSGGERSMLSGFQEAAQRIENKDENALVPFYQFYDTVHTFLESTIRRVIDRCQNAADAHDGLEQQDVNVLKLLYLIRYIDDILRHPPLCGLRQQALVPHQHAEQGHSLLFVLQLCEGLPRYLPYPPLHPCRCGGSGGGNGAKEACGIPHSR